MHPIIIPTSSNGVIVIPHNKLGGINLREWPTKDEINLFLLQIKENGWLFNYEEYFLSGKPVVAVIDRCPELPRYKEVSFTILNNKKEEINDLMSIDEFSCALPGFLLAESRESLDLESEINRFCDFLLHKYLIPSDEQREIDVGEFNYCIDKIIINSVIRKDLVELIVEAKKRKSGRIRNSGADYFIKETIPVLTGGPEKPRIKGLAEFIRAYLNSYPESFGKNVNESEKNIIRMRAVKACHTLINKLLLCENKKKVFKKYPAELVEDKTGIFNNSMMLYDLERELFDSVPRYEIQTFYDIGIYGSTNEAKEFEKERFMKKLTREDKEFYAKNLDNILRDRYFGFPLRLRIVSEVKLTE